MYKRDSNKLSNTATTTITSYKSVMVDGLSIFYREIGNPTNPKLLLLHGFPSSSHQYAYARPNAEMHRLNSGYFAMEDCLEEISNNIARFYESRVAKAGTVSTNRIMREV
jgi:hypothetical protein